MRIGLPPKDFRSIIESGMVYHNKTASIDPLVLNFTPESITIQDTYADILVAILEYDSSFFSVFESEDDRVVVSTDILDSLSIGFKEPMMLITKADKHLNLDTTRDHDSIELKFEEDKPFPHKLITVDKGQIPEKLVDLPHATLLMDAKELKFPESERYSLKFSEGELTIGPSAHKNFTRKPIIDEIITDKPFRYDIDGDYLIPIISNLSGPLMVTLHETITVFSSIGKGFKKCYILCNKEI